MVKRLIATSIPSFKAILVTPVSTESSPAYSGARWPS